jgi:hypothetical protein
MNKRHRKKAARKRYVIGCAGGVVVIYDTVTKETSFSMAHDVEPATGVALPTMQL